MAVVQTLDKYSFVRAFEESSRKDQFSHEALEAIFEYLEEYSEQADSNNIEFDIVGICCEWSEMTWQEVAMSYDVDLSQCTDDDERIGEVEDYLSRNTQYCEVSEGSFVFVNF